jgi:hypothetical protein
MKSSLKCHLLKIFWRSVSPCFFFSIGGGYFMGWKDQRIPLKAGLPYSRILSWCWKQRLPEKWEKWIVLCKGKVTSSGSTASHVSHLIFSMKLFIGCWAASKEGCWHEVVPIIARRGRKEKMNTPSNSNDYFYDWGWLEKSTSCHTSNRNSWWKIKKEIFFSAALEPNSMIIIPSNMVPGGPHWVVR